MGQRVLNRDGNWVDPDQPRAPRPRAGLRGIVGSILTAFGVVAFILGIVLFIGNRFGLLPTFRMAGFVGMTIGGVLFWAGGAVSAGTLKADLKADLKEKWEAEQRDGFRLRTGLSPRATVLVVLGFLFLVGSFLYWALNGYKF